MAENLPNLPSGAVPPKAAEPAKVQPKKETVRINLPPKPTATPAIKLPHAPPAGAPMAMAAASAGAVATTPAASPTVTAAKPTIAAAAPRAVTPALVMQAPMVAGVGAIDKILAVLAAVVGVGLLVSVFLISQSS
jgi:hypothetical protein